MDRRNQTLEKKQLWKILLQPGHQGNGFALMAELQTTAYIL